MSSGAAKPELAVNQHGATVADALNGFIGHAADGLTHDVRLDIATAYFNVGGYSLLADSLDKLSGVRLLLGAEPAPPAMSEVWPVYKGTSFNLWEPDTGVYYDSADAPDIAGHFHQKRRSQGCHGADVTQP